MRNGTSTAGNSTARSLDGIIGQMAGGMVNDVVNDESRSTGDYLSIWGQNIVAGVETGMSIDAAILSGGTGAAVAGGLGGAGLNAMTFSGRAQSAAEFGKGQVKGAAYGAIGGAVISKAAPLLQKAGQKVAAAISERVPQVAEAAGQVVSAAKQAAQNVANKFEVSEGDQLVTQAANPFTSETANQLKQTINELASRSTPQSTLERRLDLIPDNDFGPINQPTVSQATRERVTANVEASRTRERLQMLKFTG